MAALMAMCLFAGVGVALMAGFPVAFTLGGVALLFAGIGALTGSFDPVFLEAFPNRVFGIMTNETLIAVPVFVFMGVMLERSRLADQLLQALAQVMHRIPSGLGIAVMIVGALMAASTGIVGATVVTMGLLSLPTMLRHGYAPPVATGAICAAGTLGQIIPPSIVLILLADVLSNAYQQAQLSMGIFSPETISVGELFAGALLPGLALVVLYMLYLGLLAFVRPKAVPAAESEIKGDVSLLHLLGLMAGPLLLIVAVLGSILKGIATPTEAASVGAAGAMLLALMRGRLTLETLRATAYQSAKVSAMVFMILMGASLFSLVFRGLGGDEQVQSLLTGLPGGIGLVLLVVMLAMFLLGFVLDFIEITYVVVPIVGPVLLAMGVNPIWLGVMIAVNLQTSFLTPPFGFSLFYLRGVTPQEVPTSAIYRGVLPFIVIQLLMLGMLAWWPEIATWLPGRVYGG
ncbi:MAG: TRAP transporter large permease subunit [Xanthomonadales bacterium]|nr:TRAP transporter large permease subunit [Xanthomonadales bacterium]NIN60310.1 TRAP transporter large permease subunit [Xanthomonadales bacterium]NIN75662.1 TRAP transporter large permease subunit [Xanthomonadales bacterium]NIO14735.1 TRAP transporter large permease subunit [Xanthomonadales bacterium]NIP12703.1 TRAP transporter large permease subunit [Xanthomonadales bacterium]